ncbi:glycosyltransferase, partial [Gelidibacter algens]|uniref:glycosyltransferase n=1 Tax=Gelidibacter algens TaxID=49280 RepID=UPI0012FBB180
FMINKNIIYLGSMARENVFFELRKANALINPSICIETFGLTIIESFSNHCVVITTNIGGPSEIVTNGVNGIHFKSGDVEDFKRQIKTWFDFSDMQKENMRNNAFQTYLDLYSPDKQLEFFDKIYAKALYNGEGAVY